MPSKRTTQRQAHIWIDADVFEKCRRLVAFGVYSSLSELLRDGINEVLLKNAGYEDIIKDEANSRFHEFQMTETRINIDGALMRLRVYARWWHINAKTQLDDLIKELHVPGPIEDIEKKFGTKIELYRMDDNAPPL